MQTYSDCEFENDSCRAQLIRFALGIFVAHSVLVSSFFRRPQQQVREASLCEASCCSQCQSTEANHCKRMLQATFTFAQA